LQQVIAALADAIGKPVTFAVDCIGADAEKAVAAMKPGEVLVLENTRFHAGEEKNAPDLAEAFANLGDLYVNDAFSVSHLAHASTVVIAEKRPSFAGRSLQAEL
jgi:phosphoglycerate kinase